MKKRPLKSKKSGDLFNIAVSGMKFCLVLLIVLTTSIGSYAQNKKHSFEFKHASIENVLKEIQKKTDYEFLYAHEEIDKSVKINVKVESASIEEVLKQCFGNSNFTYTVVDKIITIKSIKKKKVKPTVVEKEKKVSGIVKDDKGVSLPGVSVIVVGTEIGTITNIDGEYEITVPGKTKKLLFSFIGMTAQEVDILNKTNIDVVLAEDVCELDEVIAIGYGSMKKSDLTGAVSSVSKEEITQTQSLGLDQALQGKVAGVNVTNNEGSPGSSVRIRIRGIGTVNSADPLYVVDGFPMTSGIGFLNPNDIESIEILKDASAAAIYGSRAANGVVIVTTRKGKEGKTEIAAKCYYGISTIPNKPDLMNAEQWTNAMTKAYKTGLAIDPNSEAFVIKDAPLGDTDWYDEITRVANTYNANISLRKGTAESKFSMSANYYSQEGVVIGSNFDRLNLSINSDHEVNDKLNIGQTLVLSNSKRKTSPGGTTYGILNTALKIDPITPVTVDGEYVSTAYSDLHNPVAMIDRANNQKKALDLIGTVYADYELIDDLVFKSLVGVELNRSENYDYLPKYYMSPSEQNSISSLVRGSSKQDAWLWENTLSYAYTNGRHKLNSLIGYTAQFSRFENMLVTKANVPNEEALRYLSSTGGNAPASGIATEWSILSLLARLNYNFNDKYLLTASLRTDGSSKFLADQRWGYFPSVSMAWRVSQEEFFKDLELNSISSVKLRAGWGQLGNQNIAPYQYATTYTSSSSTYAYTLGANQNYMIGSGPNSIGNEVIGWETTESYNIGLDVSMFNSALTCSLEYFSKNTNDMLVASPVPTYIGWTKGYTRSIAPFTNLGKVSNKGFEFQTTYHGKAGQLQYDLGFNLSTVKNEVKSLGNIGEMTGGGYRGGEATRTEVGTSIGEFYGYVVDGIFQNEQEIQNHVGKDGSLLQPGAIPGDFRFANLNDDNVLDANDRSFIGSPLPDFTYGINASLQYQGFDLNMFLQGVQGNDIFNALKFNNYDPASVFNKSTDMLNAWDGEGSSNSVPILNSASKNNNLRTSNFYVEDGSYLRLKTLSIGYTLDNNLVKKLNLSDLHLYVSGQNLLTFTKYTGVDPEIGQSSEADYLSNGVDNGFYPQPRMFSIGLDVKF